MRELIFYSARNLRVSYALEGRSSLKIRVLVFFGGAVPLRAAPFPTDFPISSLTSSLPFCVLCAGRRAWSLPREIRYASRFARMGTVLECLESKSKDKDKEKSVRTVVLLMSFT